MPHVVVQGARPLPELAASFQPLRERVDDCIVKLDQLYLEHGGGSALLPALTVRGALRQHFLVLVAARGDSLTVRLHELTDPERTPLVHLALALVARWLLASSPGSTVSATNIQPALDRLDHRAPP